MIPAKFFLTEIFQILEDQEESTLEVFEELQFDI
jgi:hypothetical protein